MAAKKQKPAGNAGAKKGIRRGMPTKRSINLVLGDETKVSIPKLILGILFIIVAAVLFSKFLVIDRLNAMNEANSRVDMIQKDVERTEELLSQFGDVEETYAHYTYAGMTKQEQNLVDRVKVLELVGTILPAGETALNPQEFEARLVELIRDMHEGKENVPDMASFIMQLRELFLRIVPTGYTVTSWSVNANLLTVEIRGTSLQRLNRLARQLERESIVDSCAITTANKSEVKDSEEVVHARFIVYLQKPVEEVAQQ